MATHSSILAWEIPWTEEPGGVTVYRVARVGHGSVTLPRESQGPGEPGGLPSIGSHRVGHD